MLLGGNCIMLKVSKELENQESEIRKNLFLVFIPIVIIIAFISLYQSNSIEYNKRKYEKSRNEEFHGKVIRKREEGDYVRAGRFVLLNSYHEERVDNDIYAKISVGDSVIKQKGKDSVYFFFKNGQFAIKDYNKFLRENYFRLLNE